MNPFQEYVARIQEAFRDAEMLIPPDVCQLKNVVWDSPKPPGMTVLLISPHPDDEVITGALPLRLLRESNARVINLAVTLGSDKSRQAERLEELRDCCRYIGFELRVADECGLESINLRARRKTPDHWIHAVDVLAHEMDELKPDVIVYPHVSDANSTHMGVHALVRHALLRLGESFQCCCVETEYWSPMEDPNLMLEVSAEDLGSLITALSLHRGEVSRNPYHIALPSWMRDNVRRGAELVGGEGGPAPRFDFATLYRVRQYTGRKMEMLYDGGLFIGSGQMPNCFIP